MSKSRKLLQWPAVVLTGGLFWVWMYAKWTHGDAADQQLAKVYSAMGLLAMLAVIVLALLRGDRDEPTEGAGRLRVRGIDKATQVETVVFVNTCSEVEAKRIAEQSGVIVLSVSPA